MPSSKTHNFSSDASIVLIGARGTGKSTLAHIASSLYLMTHVDVNDAFRSETGLTRSAFRQQFGVQQSRERELLLLKRVLGRNSKNSVIVIPGDYVEEAGLLLLRQFAEDHPVILVRRCLPGIQEYLRPWDPSKVERLLRLVDPIYRSCSNFEFHNWDEVGAARFQDSNGSQAEPNGQKPWSLRLKHLEQAFMHFMSNIRHKPEQPLGEFLVPNSHAVYTYLLGVTVSQLLHTNFSVGWLDCGADACQLEVVVSPDDGLSDLASRASDISRAFAKVRRFFDGPIVYHVQLPASSNECLLAQYDRLLQHGLRLGPDYLTINLALSSARYSSLMDAENAVRFIGDYHDDCPGSDGWSGPKRWAVLQTARDLGLHGLRLTQPAMTADDNRAVVNFTVETSRMQGTKPFLIAYNTMPLGRSSRCFNRVLTPITSDDLRVFPNDTADLLAQGMPITIPQLQNALYSSFTYDPMGYFVIGVDVSYSLSPVVHEAAHQFFSMPHRLHRRSLASLEGLDELVKDFNCGGVCVAQGYKMSILAHVSALSVHAQRIGAVNTLIPIRSSWQYTEKPSAEFWASRNRAGPVLGLYGDNTDWVGMRQCILQNLSPANVVTKDTTALIIGSGGIARAALYALLQTNVRHIALYNRTQSNALKLAEHFSGLGMVELSEPELRQEGSQAGTRSSMKAEVRFLPTLGSQWFSDLAQPTIIIACIPASSVAGDAAPNFTLPQAWMRSRTGGVVIDLNYSPLVTPVLRQVRKQADRGWVAVDGLENLAAQASAQFKLFTSRKVPKNLMRITALNHCLIAHKDDQEVCRIIRGQLAQLNSAT